MLPFQSIHQSQNISNSFSLLLNQGLSRALQSRRSVVSNSATPWTTEFQASLSYHPLPEPAQTHVHWIGDVIQPSHPLPSPFFTPSIFPSLRVFSNELVLCSRWPKDWSFSFSISPSNEYSGWIDRLDLLAIKGTLKNLLQHHSSKTSVLQSTTFFIVQLSHAYVTTGKTIALTRRTFVGTHTHTHIFLPSLLHSFDPLHFNFHCT